MCRNATSWPRTLLRSLLALAAALALASCAVPGGARPSPTPTALATTAAGQTLTIETPAVGITVASPIIVRGRATQAPAGSNLTYRLFGPTDNLLATGSFAVPSSSAGPVEYSGSIAYSLEQGGPGRIEIVDLDQQSGAISAIASAAVTLGPNGSLVPQPPTSLPELGTPLPATIGPQPPVAQQQILIDTPPPGTQVGSPVVITGRTARYPFQGNLGYRVLDANNLQIGLGIFPVSGGPGGPSSFSGSLSFTLPTNGGQVRAELFDQDGVGPVVASASINLSVAPPQQAIVIESPSPDTQVGSPVVITGRVVRFPTNGQLAYRVRDSIGGQIGQGSFGVVGAQDGGARFNASLSFNLPPNGGAITLDLLEFNATNNQVLSSTSLGLRVAGPQPTAAPGTPVPVGQTIVIETPSPSLTVGSPVVVTGRLARAPFGNQLDYRVRDATGNQIGSGSFTVVTPRDLNTIRFSGSLSFAEPANGGEIVVEIFDQDESSGAISAGASIRLQVAPPAAPSPRTGATRGAHAV